MQQLYPWRLRAACEDDHDFLLQLYASTRWHELNPTGWSDAEKLDFLRQQQQWQELHYNRAYPRAAFDVVLLNEPVGRLYLNRGSTEYHLIDIALLPQWRKLGIGTQMLQQVQAEACAQGCKVSLEVDVHSAARRLYERLGFRVVEFGAVRLRMQYAAPEQPLQ